MTPPPDIADLTAEDTKLFTLARATRARTGAAQGAALRDLDGRTYAACTVDLPSLHVSAVGAALAMAVASGAGGLEAAVVLGEDLAAPAPGDLDALRDVAGSGVPVLLGDVRGRPTGQALT